MGEKPKSDSEANALLRLIRADIKAHAAMEGEGCETRTCLIALAWILAGLGCGAIGLLIMR